MTKLVVIKTTCDMDHCEHTARVEYWRGSTLWGRYCLKHGTEVFLESQTPDWIATPDTRVES